VLYLLLYQRPLLQPPPTPLPLLQPPPTPLSNRVFIHLLLSYPAKLGVVVLVARSRIECPKSSKQGLRKQLLILARKKEL